jgi:hypothetical protein
MVVERFFANVILDFGLDIFLIKFGFGFFENGWFR